LTGHILVLWSEIAAAESSAPEWIKAAAALPPGMRTGIDDSVRESDRRLRLLGRLLADVDLS
jgi:hypothetical protein